MSTPKFDSAWEKHVRDNFSSFEHKSKQERAAAEYAFEAGWRARIDDEIEAIQIPPPAAEYLDLMKRMETLLGKIASHTEDTAHSFRTQLERDR